MYIITKAMPISNIDRRCIKKPLSSIRNMFAKLLRLHFMRVIKNNLRDIHAYTHICTKVCI